MTIEQSSAQSNDVIHVASKTEENRFSRFELIRWWDQKKLESAKVLVVGAGALGNEIIKNLALVGIGNIVVVDFDRIELSNLSRSILFRESDQGRYKAEVVAEKAREIFPKINIEPLTVNAVTDLGMGVYLWADIILGGLDNREARLSINQNAFRSNKTWIDGAIEGLSGVARAFSPDGPCYECTMSAIDWKILNARRSCTLLTREEMLSGKTPTTPTIASIIAAVQCQEAIKHIHGIEILSGKGYIFEGLNFYQDVVSYKRKADCYSHESYLPVIPLNIEADKITLAQTLKIIKNQLGESAIIELRQEVLTGFSCSNCGIETPFHASLGNVKESDSICSECKQARFPILAHRFDGSESWQDKTLFELGVPFFDVFIGASKENKKFFLLNGDKNRVLGQISNRGITNE